MSSSAAQRNSASGPTVTEHPAETELGGIDAGLLARARAWLIQDPDPQTRAELAALLASGDQAELASRFNGRLEFGTAGLRAELGAGPLRMNRVVVRQTTAGLVRYVAARVGPVRPMKLVVGRDARHNSDVFADDVAEVAAVATGFGCTVAAFAEAVPTPLVAFAVRHLGADAGVMITASHNPPADNGYKVYLEDGAQIIPPHDGAIAEMIAAAAKEPATIGAAKGPATVGTGEVIKLGSEVREAYLEAILAQAPVPSARQVTAVYTPLCGVGASLALAAFERAGFAPPAVVGEQQTPDPTFPGLPFPNPEEPGVLDLAIALAQRRGADVVLANDPDADRLGVAIPDGAETWRILSGNEIGALLADHLLTYTEGVDRLVVTTVVSSRLVERLAQAADVHFAATLTGFKWIVRPALEHPELRFLFGYEEALGYSVGPAVRDKDGISAALVFAELTAALRAQGSSPARRLEELARAHGLHATSQWSLRFADRHLGASQSARAMQRVRDWSGGLAGLSRSAVRDLAEGGGGLARSDAVIWDLADGGRVVFRPSGTEPKLKVYFEVVEAVATGDAGYRGAREAAQQRLATLRHALALLADA